MNDLTESVLWKKGYRINKRGEWEKPHLSCPAPSPEPERRSENGVSRSDAPKESDPIVRKRVAITSYRCRLCDPDNLVVKWHVDALRYAGLLQDDSYQHIELTVRQEQVHHEIDERTEIELIDDVT